MTGAKTVPVLDVIRHYAGIELKQKGRELWGLCPFHSEKTPSFSVNPEKGAWICHGCHAGGSSVDFVMRLRGIPFKEAATFIERDFGLDSGRREPAPVKSQHMKVLAVNEKIQQVFDWVFEAKLALRAELRRRGADVSWIMIEDLSRLEIIESELVGDPADIANGLRLFRRRFP